VLITTGRNPDAASRLIANALFLAVPGSRLENRGQRSLSFLASKAKKLHFERLCTIYRQENSPKQILFMSVGKQEKWLSPKLTIIKCSAKKLKANQSLCIKIKGTKAKAMQRLIMPKNSSDEPESALLCTAKKLVLFIGKRKILELGVKYG